MLQNMRGNSRIKQNIVMADRVRQGFSSVFSERELMFMFAICRCPSVCRLSVVCLHVVSL